MKSINKKRLKYLIPIFILIIVSISMLIWVFNYNKKIQDDVNVVNEIREQVVSVETPDIVDTRDDVDKEPIYTMKDADEKDIVSKGSFDSTDTDTDTDTEINLGIDPNLVRKIDFDKLLSINTDATRWLYIPNTNIDSYVMQERNVGEYFYGWRDIYGYGNSTGSYFAPAIPYNLEDAHLLILGHRMNNGAMFGNLPGYYNDVGSAYNYPCAYIYYPDHSERWRIWAAIDAPSDDLIYAVPYTLGSEDYKNLLEHIYDISRYYFDENPDEWTPTLFLSTCNQWTDGTWNRFLAGYVYECSYDYKTHEVSYFESNY